MIADWKTVALAKVAELNPSWKAGELDPNEEVAFVPMSAVSAESASVNAEETRRLGDVLQGYTNFADGDVLVAKITPCFENGKIAQARLIRQHGFGSTEFHVLRAYADRLDSRYLLHFLRQERIRLAGERKMTGSAGQRRVPKHFFETLLISLPPLAEQRRIAKILDRAKTLRAKRRAALAQVDTLTQAFFLDLFGNPVLNPMGWPLKKLGEIGTLERGVSKHRPRNAPELLNGIYPLVQTGEVSNCDGYIRLYDSTYSEIGLRQSKIWPAGTLCITIAANIAKTGILTFDACFPDSIVGFCADTSATVEFVRIWFSFFQKMLEDTAPESAQKNINLAILRNLNIPFPPLSLQCEFARRVSVLERLKKTHRTSLAKLDALFAALQHRAFHGEL